jgi:hypothetical protein
MTATGFDWRDTLQVHITLRTEQCCNCGVPFAMPADLMKYLRDHPDRMFYCPSGHPQHYTGKTEEQKQRERAERAEAEAERAWGKWEAEHREHKATKRQIARAMCPAGCRRHFTNLERHLDTKHPGWRAAHGGTPRVELTGPYGTMRKRPGRGPGPAAYDCACGRRNLSTSHGYAARHARTCPAARQPWPTGT